MAVSRASVSLPPLITNPDQGAGCGQHVVGAGVGRGSGCAALLHGVDSCTACGQDYAAADGQENQRLQHQKEDPKGCTSGDLNPGLISRVSSIRTAALRASDVVGSGADAFTADDDPAWVSPAAVVR